MSVEGAAGSWFASVSQHLKAILGGTEGTLDFVVLAPAYEQVKLKLLQAALAGQINRVSLDAALQMCSLSRRLGGAMVTGVAPLAGNESGHGNSP
jgi:hypothetical protein